MKGSVGVGLVVLLAVLAGSVAPVGATPSTQAGSDVTPEDVSASEFDSVTFEIHVHENASATMTFRYEVSLSDEEPWTHDDFEAFATTFESEPLPLYEKFTDQATSLVETGQERTGREMHAASFDRATAVDGQLTQHGVVELSFYWEGFAAVEDERLIVDDVFSEPSLTDGQAIVITADDGMTFHSAEPEPAYPTASLESAERLQWHSDHELLAGQPRVVLGAGGEPAGSDSPLSSSPDGTIDGLSLWVMGFLLVVSLLGLAIGFAWYNRDPPASSTHRRPDSDTAAETAAENGSPPAEADESPQTELLSDEDHVIALLEDNGGRMKQVKIVDETGWSKSKVSMLLSEMANEGMVSKLRVGRENIVSLEGHEPEASKSPFEE